MFKIALAQMLVEGGHPDRNLDRAEQRVAQAAAQHAQVVVLPEALDLGWTHGSARALAEPIPEGTPCDRLARAACKHGVYVCAGLTERAGSSVFNAAVLLDLHGRVLLHHRKLNELEIGHGTYDQGDRLGVARSALATFGLMICADAFARGQIVSRTLALMGADVILSPCAWAVPADHDQRREPYGRLWLDHYQPVAREFQLWIAGVSNVGQLTDGPWNGRRCIGCSLLIDPEGEPVIRGPYGADSDVILYAEVQPRPRVSRGDGWWHRLDPMRSA